MTGLGETTAVEAHFDAVGKITPRRFTWHNSTLVVEGVGRRWREGNQRCFAVLAAGGRPFELRLDEETLLWRVICSWVPGPAV